jgi:Skp family chaperone for outer membrane proteins
MLLGIHRENTDKTVIESGVKELQKMEKEMEEKKAATKSSGDTENTENDEIESEINEALMTHEQQMQRA